MLVCQGVRVSMAKVLMGSRVRVLGVWVLGSLGVTVLGC